MNKRVNIHFIFIMLAASLWGTAGIFVRAAQKFNMSQMEIVFCRAFFTSLIIGLIICFIKRDLTLFKVKLKDIWLFMLTGVVSIILFNYSYYKTMALASLSVAAILLYTAPFFVMIISVIFFKEKLTVRKAVACIVAFIGCSLVSGILGQSAKISGEALFFGILTGFGYAFYTVFGEILIKKGYKTLTITFYVFLFAGIGSIPLMNPVSLVGDLTENPASLLNVFLMSVFNTVLPYLFYTTGLRGVEPSTAPIFASVEPVVATLVGLILFNEPIGLPAVIGIILVLGAVIVLNKTVLRINANAKINLCLAITGKRDDGYHLIDTVMQSVTLRDRVTLSPCRKIKVICSSGDIAEEKNIAYIAAKTFFEEVGINAGVKIRLRKSIPMCAGLGGGSADAAAVLMGLNKMFGTEFSKLKLCEMAVKLGADVPFFIEGGTVRAEGIGEVLTKLEDFKGGYFILAKEGSKPSTAEMYRRLDSSEHPIPDNEKFSAIINQKDFEKSYDLMDNSFISVWENSKIKEKLQGFNPKAVSLSGSGPVWFAYFTDKAAAKNAYKVLKKQGVEVYFTKPCDHAIKIV